MTRPGGRGLASAWSEVAGRLTPPGLAGSGRRAAWRRARARRVVSALLVGAAAWIVAGTLLPHPPLTGEPVVVAARDLPAGHVLSATDLRVARWPAEILPARKFADPGLAVGEALSGGVAEGEAVTASRVLGAGLLTGQPPGVVAAHVPLADGALAAVLHPGDHVDVLSSAAKGVLAEDLVVLSIDGPTDGASGAASGVARGVWGVGASTGSSSGPGVVVAATPEVAVRISGQPVADQAGSPLSLVLRPPVP